MMGQQERTRCYGRVLEMNRSRGWILPLQEIAHPAAGWNKGHIYLDTADVRAGFKLKAGDLVTFHLYADKKGLGAEDCLVVQLPPEARQAAEAAAAAATLGRWPSTPQAPHAPTAAAFASAQAGPPRKPAWWAHGETAQQKPPSQPQWGGYRPSPPPYAPPPPQSSQSPEGSRGAAAPAGPPPGLEKPFTDEYVSSPPGLGPMRDNFSVNAAFFDSDDEEEDDFGTATQESDGSQSVSGSVFAKSTKSSAGDVSTCAGFSSLSRASIADSDKWTTCNSPETPAARVLSLEKALNTGAATGVFSDDGENSDEEPAMEPSPLLKERSVSDPAEAPITTSCRPPSQFPVAGKKVYNI